MEKDKIYFGEQGLTSTSANFISNQAKEFCQTINEELNNISFVDGEIALVGGNYTSTKKGVKDVSNLQEKLDQVTKAYSLIAWLREAIKAKENLTKETTKKELLIWCQDNNKEYPQLPEPTPVLTEDDILATWSIKDRNRYLSLNTKVSVYGKFIHPTGPYSTARKELKERINNPVDYTESGRDTIIHKYVPSLDTKTVDDEFFTLQSTWRKAQAELNGYKHKIQLAMDESLNKSNTKYSQDYAEYERKSQAVHAEFKAWKDKTLQEIANLKIIIPAELTIIYQLISSLSK